MSEGKTTTDHDEIRQWAEERGGVPATVKGTERGGKKHSDEAGILRLDFEPRDEGLEEIDWEGFFEKFDKEKLAFLYQEETADGSTSRFHKFVNRPAGAEGGKGKSAGSGGKSASGSSGKSASDSKSGGGGKSAASSSGGKSAGDSKSASGGEKSASSSGGKSAGDSKSAGGGEKSASSSEGKSASDSKSAGGGKSASGGKNGATKKSASAKS